MAPTSVLALALALALAVASAPAHGLDVPARPDPGAISPFPRPGEVVDRGAVAVGAWALARGGIERVEMRIDGDLTPATLTGSDPTVRRFAATRSGLAPGAHLVEVAVFDRAGHMGTRWWRFAVADVEATRLAGGDRIATAVAISRDAFTARSAAAVVIARADDYADALAGAPFVADRGGPLLLSATAALSPATATEVRRVLPPGGTVYLLGGEVALSARVERDLGDLGFEVVRIEGTDRFETAREIARRIDTGNKVVIASGTSFADALAASAPAARDGMPILLATRDDLPSATSAYLSTHDVDRAYLVGGEAVLSREVAMQVDALVGNVQRVWGLTRYETGAAVVAEFYGPTEDTIAVATGDAFADALAGGYHAALHGAPLVLAPQRGFTEVQARLTSFLDPERAYVYGGPAAIAEDVLGDLRSSSATTGPTLRLVHEDPAPFSTTSIPDTITFEFDRELTMGLSFVHATLNGQEVYGELTTGDFATTLVFDVTTLPFRPAAYTPHDLRISVLATAADGGTRWFERRLTYVKLDIGPGDAGEPVLDLQHRLADLGYWVGTPDGNYGTLTVQAVMAFQKMHGFARTGQVDTHTRDALAVATRPLPRSTGSGRLIEIDKTRQVLLVVQDGAVVWAFNTSTGTETEYVYEGRRGFAHTPEGHFTLFRQIDGPRESHLGWMWRPKYFTSDGVAIHGSSSVPSYPASHGCVRLTNPAMDYLWASGLAPLGTPVWVYA